MRSTNVLLLLALISISAVHSNFQFASLAEVQELKASATGKSLIETISLTLDNNGSVADVQKLLDDLLYKLNKDQEDSDRDWEKTNRTLSEKIDELTTQIEELRVKISGLDAEIQEYTNKINTGNDNLKQYNEDFAHNTNSLDALEKKRKTDHEAYKAAVQEHGDVINAIEAVIAELSKLKGSVSGVGKPAHVEEIDAETRDREYAASQAAAAQATQAAAVQASFLQITKDAREAMIFAQLATSADQAALEKLIGLLVDLENSVKKSLNDDEAFEAQSIASYDSLKESLTKDNDNLGKLINEQTNNIKDYTDKVSRLTAERDENAKLKASKESELALTIKERQDKENQYNSDKAQRDSERTVILKLQQIVTERLANMSKFLKDSTNA